ncbi:hypothetical protein ABZ930_23170 [Streptomyces sp. NPDC046716]|uniref:DUF6891 domain-containing protein n=1 Tax=Streptomyces sp. NPDC046716 TaxID=3157093 RepID=UPI0033FE32B0
MLAITVKTEDGRRHVRPTAEELAALVRRIGGAGDKFLVVQPIPDKPDEFIQVWHAATGPDFTLEYRDGAADRHFQTMLDAPEPVIAAMTAWARRAPDWSEGFEWERLDFGPIDPAPALDLGDEDRRLLEDRIREVLVAGYATRAELAEVAEDYLVSGDVRPVSRKQAEALADRMWLDRVEEQAAWGPEETAPDLIARAFTALEATGVTARENFTCCRSCGDSEIRADGVPEARGFVYFHTQSTDMAAAGRGLALQYGGFDDSPETTASIGREVVDALKGQGLATEWDGDPGQVITVTPLEWRRRLVG